MIVNCNKNDIEMRFFPVNHIINKGGEMKVR